MSNKHKFFIYALEAVIALVLVFWNLQIFLVYAFVVLIWKIDRAQEHLQKVASITQLETLIKVLAIADKLNVSQEDIDAVAKKVDESWKVKMTPKQYEKLNKELDKFLY